MFDPMQSVPRMGYKPEDSLATKVLAHSGNFLLNCVDFGIVYAVGEVKRDATDRLEDFLFDYSPLETATRSLEIEAGFNPDSYR